MPMLFLGIIYLAFISLGLPDSMLGAAWPAMHVAFQAPVGQAGSISLVIAAGTVASSLLSSRVVKRYGTGKVVFASVLLTAIALLGISFAPGIAWLYVLAIPLGLGAGAVDAGLNGYVARHYAARHMNWLHCFWGVGATLGPIIMGFFLSGGNYWQGGYRTVAGLQFLLVLLLFFSLPLWRENGSAEAARAAAETKTNIFRLPGVKWTLVAFFLYCSLEITAGLWCASFLVTMRGLSPANAAQWTSLFYGGITFGRLVSGFLTLRLKSKQLIRLGLCCILLGCGVLLLPGTEAALGMGLIGLGCAPIYPALLHETPARFGEENSQRLMGIQMASAYVGSTLMPALMGGLTGWASLAIYPWFLLGCGLLMLLSTERVNRILAK